MTIMWGRDIQVLSLPLVSQKGPWEENNQKTTYKKQMGPCVYTAVHVCARVCTKLPTCFVLAFFFSGTVGVRDAQVNNIGQQSSLLLHLYKTAGDKNPFSWIFQKGRASRGWRASPVQSVHAFLKKEKHTGQNAMDLKCRCKSGWPGVSLFSPSTQS